MVRAQFSKLLVSAPRLRAKERTPESAVVEEPPEEEVPLAHVASLVPALVEAKESSSRLLNKARAVLVEPVPRAPVKETSIRFLHGAAYQNWFAEVLDSHHDDVVEICFTAFSLDAKEVLAGICSVPSGANRRVLADRRQTFGDMGTKQQYTSLRQLHRAGVEVRVGEGSSVTEGYTSRGRTTGVGADVMGRIHAKSAYIRLGTPGGREYLFIGSCNWTDASVSNYEASVCVVNPDAAVVREWKAAFESHWTAAGSLDEVADIEHRRSQRSPTRRSKHWD
jgi:hypothetical protein